MPNLECTVRTCYHNKDQKCCLEGIRVRGSEARTSDSTACGSFREKSEGMFTNACECEKTPGLKSMVQCEAVKCRFNSDKKCAAESIDIVGENAKSYIATECKTFVCSCK